MKASALIAALVAALGVSAATRAQPGLIGNFADSNWRTGTSFPVPERDGLEDLLNEPVETQQLNSERLSGQVVEGLANRLDAKLRLSMDQETGAARQE